MKRALAITLTVAMIGALAFMGFAGTAAAQEDIENASDFQYQDMDQTTGDASVDVSVDQSNDNAQVGSATAGDAVALSDGGGAGAVGAAAHDKGGSAAGATDGGAGSATAASAAETNQAQDVTQINNADVDATAESGDNVGVQTQVAVDDDDVDEEEPEEDVVTTGALQDYIDSVNEEFGDEIGFDLPDFDDNGDA